MSAVNGHGNRAPSRTRAATLARRQAGAKRLALDVALRLELVDDRFLTALAFVVVSEMHRRQLRVPQPDE